MDNERDIEIAAIKLMIDTKLPKDEAHELLARGSVKGKIVLICNDS